MTPDDVLGPRIQGTLRLEDGREIGVSARPRKDGGFTNQSLISFGTVGERGWAGLRVELLRWFASMEATAPPRTPVMRVVAALEAQACEPKRQTSKTYYAHCPGHDGRAASLNVTWDERRVLLTCRATCTTEEILAALGLSTSDLFSGENLDPGPVMGVGFPITMRDAGTILDWLASQGEQVSW